MNFIASISFAVNCINAGSSCFSDTKNIHKFNEHTKANRGLGSGRNARLSGMSPDPSGRREKRSRVFQTLPILSFVTH